MSPAAGIRSWFFLVASTSHFFEGLDGRQRKEIVCTKNMLRISFVLASFDLDFLFFERRKQAQKTCDLFRVLQQKAICFSESEITNA